MKLVVSFLLLSCTLFGQWMTDVPNAIEKSSREKKPLLLFFTASDWSGWSMKFKDDVLTNSIFQEKIGDAFVCVEIDTPRNAPLSTEGERFHITEFPTLLVLSPDQREISRFGYLPLSGEQFADDLLYVVAQDRDLAYMLALLERGERTLAILEKAYHLAEELCNQEAIEQVLDYGIESREPGFYLVEKYRRKSDPVLKEKVEKLDDPELLYHIAVLDFQENQGVGALEEFLQNYGERAEEYRWQLEMMIAQYYLDQDDASKALEHAEVAKASAPSNKQEEIGHSVDYIRSVAR